MRNAIFVAHATLCALAASACVPTDFEDVRARGQTRSLAPPADYPTRAFGATVAGYAGTLDGAFSSRVAGTAGANTPYTVYPLHTGDRVRLDVPVMNGCDDGSPCMGGAGVSLVGLHAYGGRALCLAVASTEAGEMKLRCEDDVTRPILLAGPAGEGFGASGAALLAPHPFGVAIFGAPGAGRVYRLGDTGGPVDLDLSEADGVGEELGSAVAITALDADTVLLASAANAGTRKRVVIATSSAVGGVIETRVRDCLDENGDGWGAALALGDLSGDGVPDLVIGSGEGPSRLDAVRIYDGAELPAEGTCDGTWEHALELACPTVEGVDCSDALFGATLAIGDLDGDGIGDLLAGAPGASVDEVTGAGAVFVFRGGELGSLGSTDRVSVLAHSAPSRDDRLGAALAVAPGLDRDEPVVGAPGADRVYVFLCSGLMGDTEATTPGMLCQPR